MSSDDGKCIICNERFGNHNTTIVRRGIPKLVEASQKREDGKFSVRMNELSELEVHSECRKWYTRDSSITASKPQGCSEPASKIPRLRPRDTRFNYRNDCLFCGQPALSPNLKLPKSRRREIRIVETKQIENTILSICKSRNDDLGETVRTRMAIFTDLSSEEARYHFDCYSDFKRLNVHEKPGRPTDDSVSNVFELLFDYLESHDECQYTLSDIRIIIKGLPGGDICEFSDYILKSRLKAKYGKGITCSDVKGKPTVLSFTGTSHKILTDQWYENRTNSEEGERIRIVETAAAIIEEDIQRQVYENKLYPSCEDMESGGKDLVPQSLQIFVRKLTSGRKLPSESLQRKQTVISHAIIALRRPRSFISPIQLSTAVHFLSKYGSRYLIDTLFSLGLSSSYQEANKYLNCAGSSLKPNIDNGAFVQYVFDNADANINSLDGLGTIHILGGIQCITPKQNVTLQSAVPRDHTLKLVPKCNEIPIVPYKKPHRPGLKNIIMEDVSMLQDDVTTVIHACKLDLLWLIGFTNPRQISPSWSGYMHEVTQETGTFKTSRIMALPFINLEATNMTSLNSALTFAANESASRKMACIVTFDQPLFIKASEIVAAADTCSPLSRIVVRLGTFHLLMSFLGSIGNIMKGSGLEELWSTVYAKNSTQHMITGHAFSRAVRAHVLTLSALFYGICILHPDLHGDNIEMLLLFHQEFLTKRVTAEQVILSTELKKFEETLEDVIKNLKEKGRTQKLWLQYIDQVKLVMHLIRAERTGDWQLHISTVKKMLPYFHAAGHILYAKSAHLYCQQMSELESRLSPEEFKQFTIDGYFTIRRADRFWSGTSTDMIIEQCLMRSLKSSGGLTHGRGITENTLMRWVTCAPINVEVSQAFQIFTNVSPYTSEQHIEERLSRQERDAKDKAKFIKWIEQHNPFDQSREELISLSSGLVADSDIDCFQAQEKGHAAMSELVGKDFGSVTVKRKNKVTNFASMNIAIKVRGNNVYINTQQLFNRILCVTKNSDELKSYFRFELAPRPPSLFDDVSMRKGKKSSLIAAFQPAKESEEKEMNESKPIYILDGGHLLHSVVWPRPATYGDIIDNYTSSVLQNYGRSCIVVFDGYPDYPTTKGCEQHRRALRKTSADIHVSENTVTTTSQAEFLQNRNNKKALICSIATRFDNEKIFVKIAEADADVDIASAAFEKAALGATAVVVGQDTDLLVLLTSLSTNSMDIWFHRPGSRGGKSSSFHIPKQRALLKQNLDIILFLHAVTGCDTTSTFFRKSKLKALQILDKKSELKQNVTLFNKPDVTPEEISAAGEKFILSLYGSTKNQTLDEYRYYYYNRITSKQNISSKFDLAVLPPTSAAATQHSYRTYLQVQQWRGNQLRPTEWGWHLHEGMLKPVCTCLAAAPTELLNLISCGCKIECKKNCECSRAGLRCSAMCGYCQGTVCSNAAERVMDDFDE